MFKARLKGHERGYLLMDRVIAGLIRRDPSILDRARLKLLAVVDNSSENEWWVFEWLLILDRDQADIRKFLISRSPEARRMSSCSPFYDDVVLGFEISNVAWRIRALKKAAIGLDLMEAA